MRMEDYLNEIEFAVTQVLSAVWHEHAEVESINAEMVQLSKSLWKKYMPDSPYGDDEIAEVKITGPRPSVFLTPEDEMLYQKNDKRRIIDSRILTRQFAVNALSGTLLQFAKQGISIVHGGLDSCPNGRAIGSQPLKAIIWNGRNQSLHWEEGVNRTVSECFRQLVREAGLAFAAFNTDNLGFEVVSLLSWRTFADFKSDMLSLK